MQKCGMNERLCAAMRRQCGFIQPQDHHAVRWKPFWGSNCPKNRQIGNMSSTRGEVCYIFRSEWRQRVGRSPSAVPPAGGQNSCFEALNCLKNRQIGNMSSTGGKVRYIFRSEWRQGVGRSPSAVPPAGGQNSCFEAFNCLENRQIGNMSSTRGEVCYIFRSVESP